MNTNTWKMNANTWKMNVVTWKMNTTSRKMNICTWEMNYLQVVCTLGLYTWKIMVTSGRCMYVLGR